MFSGNLLCFDFSNIHSNSYLDSVLMDIEIKVISGEKEISRIKKKLSLINGVLSVNYNGKTYPVTNNKIILDSSGTAQNNIGSHKGRIHKKPYDLSGVLKHSSPSDKKHADSAKKDKITDSPSLKKETAEEKINAERDSYAQPLDSNRVFPKMDWDDKQKIVIEYSPDARITVQAGPGTGKTEVACARVAWLIDHENTSPGNIWLISFTRTAVQEVRNRIKDYLENGDSVHYIKIATIDSRAWSIHSGFDEKAHLIGSYEDNIQSLLKLVKNNEGVGEYLETVEHLIVDEAQDIVGIRAELILEIIKKLSKTCGVTVFADDAQAIYGFALDDDNESAEYRLTLSEQLRSLPFEKLELDTVHRTKSPSLKKIFYDLRKKVVKGVGDFTYNLNDIKREIEEIANERALNINNLPLEELNECFILFRRRADVLQQSSFFEKKPHRIRMSGMPTCIQPWIGMCFSEHTKPEVTRTVFSKLWRENIKDSQAVAQDEESAWGQLFRIAGMPGNSVNITTLRQRLGKGAPPAQFCNDEIGLHGPILGTIHASKGREAKQVYLMLPITNTKNADSDEEKRVVFVGATRAREKLLVGYGYRHYADRINGTGRVCVLKTGERKPRAQVEIGINGDITAEGIAGRRYYSSNADVRARQKKLYDLDAKITAAHADNDHNNGHVYRLIESETGLDVAVLSEENINHDFFSIGKKIQEALRDGYKRRPPDKLDHLRIFGLRTLVLPPDSPDCEKLLDPWSKSGIMLAPVIFGYTTAYFPYYR